MLELSLFSPFYSVLNLGPWRGTTVRVCFPTLLNTSQIPALRDQGFPPMETLNPIKLMIKTSHWLQHGQEEEIMI